MRTRAAKVGLCGRSLLLSRYDTKTEVKVKLEDLYKMLHEAKQVAALPNQFTSDSRVFSVIAAFVSRWLAPSEESRP